MKTERYIAVLMLLLVGGCATPAAKISEYARASQFSEDRVETDNFRHVLYRSAASSTAEVKLLHVYLEGDGLPWIFRYFRMPDPTPRRPLMLQLMTLDRNQALYLGRPCYNGLAASAGCNNQLWTSARYSPAVVNSMVAVLRTEIRAGGIEDVRLFGHSGGGALALLIAEQIPQVKVIVTLAGNLDTDAWIQYHGYSPLYTSLNPASRPALSEHIDQIHYLAGRDTNIPPRLNSSWVNAQKNSVGIVAQTYTHSCCWRSIWPRVLQAIEEGKPYRLPGKIFKRDRSRIPEDY